MKKNLLMVIVIIAVFAMIAALPVSGDSAQDYKVIKKASDSKSTGGEVQWFKLTVYDTKEKKTKVKITIPLAIVELFADKDDKVKIADKEDINAKEVLALLKKNGPMTLIEIEEEDQVVKIWLE